MCKSNQKDVFDFKIYVCTCITAEIISNLNLGLEHIVIEKPIAVICN